MLEYRPSRAVKRAEQVALDDPGHPMATKKAVDPTATLAQGIRQALERRRVSGTGYPATLREVAGDVEAGVSDSNLKMALTKAPLKSNCVTAIEGDVDSLAVLNDKEDIQRLAGDDRILRLLCERLCSPQQPIVAVKELAGAGVLAKKVATAFKAHWDSRVKAGTVPAFVAVVAVPGKTAKAVELKLHDLRFPLPWLSLSKDLVQALRQPSPSGGLIADWPELVARVSGASHVTMAALARNSEPYKSQVVPVLAKEPLGGLVLVENAQRAISDPRVLDRVYQTSKKPHDTAIDVAFLKKQKVLSPELTAAFAQAVDRWTAGGGVPQGYGLVRVSKKSYLFRLADASASGSAGAGNPPTPTPPLVNHSTTTHSSDSEGFSRTFSEAFDRLDAQHGSYNFVKLLHLRNALPQYSRSAFDAGLEQLRKRRLFSLEASEGHLVTLTDEERAAGIVEVGRHLIYCKRVRSV